MKYTPALFLDRDGVINFDSGYVYRQQDFLFINGIFDLVRRANAAGHRVVVVTNQAGIARGLYSEEDFQSLTSWMVGCFAREGAEIDAVYHSPYHPTHGIGPYRQDTYCRKPAPGMILAAAADLKLDLAASTLVGDRLSDIEAGFAAGVSRLILFGPRVEKAQTFEVVDSLESINFRFFGG
jgi:D-glycero-D-manno-heptose 1,7-bisphosphate phosphatase